jgi:hypothetical protein
MYDMWMQCFEPNHWHMWLHLTFHIKTYVGPTSLGHTTHTTISMIRKLLTFTLFVLTTSHLFAQDPIVERFKTEAPAEWARFFHAFSHVTTADITVTESADLNGKIQSAITTHSILQNDGRYVQGQTRTIQSSKAPNQQRQIGFSGDYYFQVTSDGEAWTLDYAGSANSDLPPRVDIENGLVWLPAIGGLDALLPLDEKVNVLHVKPGRSADLIEVCLELPGHSSNKTPIKLCLHCKPSDMWLPQMATLEYADRGATAKTQIQFTYGIKDELYGVVMSSSDTSLKSMALKSESQFEFSKKEVPPKRFRLPYYGLPERQLIAKHTYMTKGVMLFAIATIAVGLYLYNGKG